MAPFMETAEPLREDSLVLTTKSIKKCENKNLS